ILKPPTGEFDGHAENEHVCMQLASALGLITASSEVLRFEDQVAIVIERYSLEYRPRRYSCAPGRRVPGARNSAYHEVRTRGRSGRTHDCRADQDVLGSTRRGCLALR